MELLNLTHYAAAQAVRMDGAGRETLLVAIKATFTLDEGLPKLAEQQSPLVRADEYRGEPGASSLLRAAEMCLSKPSADVVLTGWAYPAQSTGTEAQVVLAVASVNKMVRVTGDRGWGGPFGATASSPEPFARMDLSYERAFGGRDDTSDPPETWAENPVGRGFRGENSQLPTIGAPLPNLEDPKRPMRSPTDRLNTCSLGPISPGWRPRSTYAGTYDDRWRRDRMPFPPDDLDLRYENTAPPDQVLAGYLTGGERVRISGVRDGGGGYDFTLPALRPEVVVRIGNQRETPRLSCDSLAIDAEAQRLSMVFRSVVDVHGRLAGLRWTKVQEGPRA
jgi:hypothetical protein